MRGHHLIVGLLAFGLPIAAEGQANDRLCRLAERLEDYLPCRTVADAMPEDFLVSLGDAQTISIVAMNKPAGSDLPVLWPMERFRELSGVADTACDSLAAADVPPFFMRIKIRIQGDRQGTLLYSKPCWWGSGQ